MYTLLFDSIFDLTVWLPCLVRRPRAATGESVSRPLESSSSALLRGPPSPQPQPSSSDSLTSPSTPPPPPPSIGQRRRTFTQPPSSPGGIPTQGSLPSPPASAREDPLAGFGHRLLRRISNHGGSNVQPVPGQGLNGHRPSSAGGAGPTRSDSTGPPAPSSSFGPASTTRQTDLDGVQLEREQHIGDGYPRESTWTSCPCMVEVRSTV